MSTSLGNDWILQVQDPNSLSWKSVAASKDLKLAVNWSEIDRSTKDDENWTNGEQGLGTYQKDFTGLVNQKDPAQWNLFLASFYRGNTPRLQVVDPSGTVTRIVALITSFEITANNGAMAEFSCSVKSKGKPELIFQAAA